MPFFRCGGMFRIHSSFTVFCDVCVWVSVNQIIVQLIGLSCLFGVCVFGLVRDLLQQYRLELLAKPLTASNQTPTRVPRGFLFKQAEHVNSIHNCTIKLTLIDYNKVDKLVSSGLAPFSFDFFLFLILLIFYAISIQESMEFPLKFFPFCFSSSWNAKWRGAWEVE